VEVEHLALGFHRVVVHYGYFQTPNVPAALKRSPELNVDPDDATYYIHRQTFLPSKRVAGMASWREQLFTFMANNAATSANFLGIPPERVLELGIEVEI
jgi:KUP system potassium uptake protein